MTTGTLLTVGQTYGARYRVEAYIGQGGMQEVYEAEDTILERKVAIKVPKNSSAERRFDRSAILSARVNHPNVAKTLDYFEDGNRFYLIEELIVGINLSEMRQQIPTMDPYSTAHVFHNLARGVAASHHVRVIHRDLKPSNIMVDGDLQLRTIKITDFGIAKMVKQEMDEAHVSEASITSSHTMMGALPYLSPEMIRKPKDAGPPADIWALGAITYELLTGNKPFGGGLTAVPTILAAIPPALPNKVTAKNQFHPIARAIYDVILQCLQKDPALRPTADELVVTCGGICYQTAERFTGMVQKYQNQTFGFITPEKEGAPVFFHVESVYGDTPDIGERVWYSMFPGEPRNRAHPVVPISKQ